MSTFGNYTAADFRADMRHDAEDAWRAKHSCRTCKRYVGPETTRHRVTSIAQIDPPDEYWRCESCDDPLCESCCSEGNGFCKRCRSDLQGDAA